MLYQKNINYIKALPFSHPIIKYSTYTGMLLHCKWLIYINEFVI